MHFLSIAIAFLLIVHSAGQAQTTPNGRQPGQNMVKSSPGKSNIVPFRAPGSNRPATATPGRITPARPNPKKLQCAVRRVVREVRKKCPPPDRVEQHLFSMAKVAAEFCQYHPDDTVSIAATAATEIMNTYGTDCIKSVPTFIQANLKQN
jgi:hypothetical protein